MEKPKDVELGGGVRQSPSRPLRVRERACHLWERQAAKFAGRLPATYVLAWGVVIAFLLVDAVWFQWAKLSFAKSNIWLICYTAFFLAVLGAIPVAIQYRLRTDSSRFAGALVSMAHSLGLLVHAAAFTTAIGIVGVTFSYLSTSLALPLRDAELAAIDRFFGFDWPLFLSFSNQPLISWILKEAYHSAGVQLVALYVYLSFAQRADRLGEFMAVFALSSLLTGIGMTLVPAEGAYAYYRPAVQDFSNFSISAGMWHHSTFTALRVLDLPILDFKTSEGLVTFPSFHTALAIIIWYPVRDVRIVSPVVATLNAVVIIGTLPEGGHHLVDLVAGAAVALGAIVAVGQLGRWSASGPVSARVAQGNRPKNVDH